MTEIDRFAVVVRGRPAPQGSKRTGPGGQMREQSAYLPAWRAAVRRAVYERYKVLGVLPTDLPLLVGAVRIARCAFVLPPGRRVDSPPDLDKLLRSTWDALTKARVWEDDGRVVAVDGVSKVLGDETGAEIEIWRMR